jgi:phosphoesterase RecJ-like protein
VTYNERRTLGWFSVTQEMLAKTGAAENLTENFVNYVRAVDGVQVAVFFQEMTNGRVKISFRSRGTVDVSAIAHELGGGGHRQAAGVQVAGPLEEAQARVLAAVQARMPKD